MDENHTDRTSSSDTKLLPVEVVLGLFLPKHCRITPERATLNLAGI